MNKTKITITKKKPARDGVRFIDLFSGIGSFHQGFLNTTASPTCVLACDISEEANKTYYNNYGILPRQDICDVSDTDILNLTDIDVVCAGFPCQPFSIAGKRKGFDDKDGRGTMFFEVLRFQKCNPKAFILENVKGLVSHDKGKTLSKMIDMLDKSGYNTQYKVLTCSDYGIPQMRKRLFIVALRKDLIMPPGLLEFPTVTCPDLSTYLGVGVELLKKMAYTIRCGGRKSPIESKQNWDGYYTKDKKDVYRLTISDCLALQGFQPDFHLYGTDTKQYKLLGNTIPTNLTTLVCKAVLKAIS